MEILYLSQYYPPEMGAAAVRVSELSKYWVQMGHKVNVVTGMPNHPDGIIHPSYKREYFKEEKHFGVKVLRVILYMTPNKGVIKRVIGFISFMITSFIVGLLKSNIDIVIATSPQLFVGLSGLIIAKLKNKPFVFEIRDIWPHSAVQMGVIKNKIIIKMMENLAMFLYRKADRIIIVIEEMREYLTKRGIDPSKIKFIPNGADAERFRNIKKKKIIEKYVNIKEHFIIGYIGVIGMAKGLEILVKAAKKIKDKRVFFVMIGDGAEKEKMGKLIKESHLKNIVLINKIPACDVPSALGEIDMGLVHIKDVSMIVLPAKMYEIMAAGKPILAGLNDIRANFIE